MKSEMEMIEQLMHEHKLDSVQAGRMLHALDDSEDKAVWEQDGEYDPRRFMARLAESYTSTMLDDVIRVEHDRLYSEALEELRALGNSDRARRCAELTDRGRGASSVPHPTLLATLRALDALRGIEGLQYLLDLKADASFADTRALRHFSRSDVADKLRRESSLVEAQAPFQADVSVARGTVVRVHIGYRRLEIVPSTTGKLRVVAVKHGWAESEEEARRTAEATQLRIVPDEGKRCWILNDICGIDASRRFIDLRLEVPAGITFSGFATEVAARGIEGDLRLWGSRKVEVDACSGNVSVHSQYIGAVSVKALRGDLSVDTFSAPVNVQACTGDIKLKTILSDARVLDLGGQCSFRSIEGSIELEGIRSSGLTLRTKHGHISLSGLVMPEGSYELRTKTGDIAIALHPDSDCGLSAETRQGTVDWSHPAEHWNPDDDPKRAHANIRSGSGGLGAVSETGTISVTSLVG